MLPAHPKWHCAYLLAACFFFAQSSPLRAGPHAGDHLKISGPNGDLAVTIDRADPGPSRGDADVYGHLDLETSSDVILVFRGAFVHGAIYSVPGGTLEVTGTPDYLCAVPRNALADRKPCLSLPPTTSVRTAASCPDSISTLRGYSADDGLTIDVMVVYTQAAANAAGGVAQIESNIDLAKNTANQILMNSGVAPRIRIIRKALISYTESHDALTDLNRLVNPSDGYLDSVHPDRDTYGADLVSLWVDNIETGGVAYQLSALGPDDDGKAGFSVMRQDNASFETFAHELGHNFGCQHDRANQQGNGFFYYSYGYRDAPVNNWHTVMAYPPGSVILYFSNPTVSYNGPLGDPGPTGVGGTDPSTASNNALTIANTAWTVANFRPSTLTSTPTARLYVKPSAPSGGTGASWATAIQDVQKAISVAVQSRGTVTEIWVAAGTYKPDLGRNDRLMYFRPVNGVSIYGGFAGTETLLSQRNFAANPTILSGDIGVSGDASDNSYHVVYGVDLNATAILDGFTITGGNANADYKHDSGGGFYSACGSPTIRNCTFTNNAGLYGGGAYCNNCSPQFISCTFSNNNSPNYGGAVYVDTSASPTFSSCTFQLNTAPIGGAVLVDGTSPVFMMCTFTQNSCPNYGGAVALYNAAQPNVAGCTFNQNSAGCCGGVLSSFGCNFTITGSTFTANSSNYGATLWADSPSTPVITNCRFFGNTGNNSGGAVHTTNSAAPTYTNCVFSGNRALNGYGGFAYDLSNSAASFINCSASNNTAAPFAGGIWADGCTTTLSNCVLWQNTDVNGAIQSSQLTNNNGATATVSYTNMQGWTGSLGGTANNGSNPLFTDADGPDNVVGTIDDDLRPSASSSCLDSGNNAAVPVGVTTDVAGNPRFANMPCIADSGAGSPPIIDRGAYERIPLAQLLGDVDGNGVVNLADLSPFVAVLLGTDTNASHVAAADMNCDNFSNGEDIASFIAKLLGS